MNRLKENINQTIVNGSNTIFSKHHKHCLADSRENYQIKQDIGSERVKMATSKMLKVSDLNQG